MGVAAGGLLPYNGCANGEGHGWWRADSGRTWEVTCGDSGRALLGQCAGLLLSFHLFHTLWHTLLAVHFPTPRYDIEDAIVMNKYSLDRGFGRCIVLKKYGISLKK